MALKLGSLFYEFGAETSKLKTAQKEIITTNKKVTKSFGVLQSAITAAISLESARRILMIADNMTRLKGRIDTLTKSQKESNKLFKDLVALANEVGIRVEGVAQAFQRFALVKDIVGASNDQVIQFTANIQKLGIVSGATGQEITSTSIQIGQAIANNFEAAAQEINSINEQLPEVARAVERSLNLIPGSFKKAVTDGQVTSEQFFNAILQQTETIDAKFAKLPVTIERATATLANNFAVALTEADDILGTTRQIASSIENIARITSTDWTDALIHIRTGFIQLFGLISTSTTKLRFGVQTLQATIEKGFKNLFGLETTQQDKRLEDLKTREKAELDVFKNVTTGLVAELEKRRAARALEKNTGTLESLDRGPNVVRGRGGGQATVITEQEKLLAAMGDETQAIENALIDRENKILAITKITEDKRFELLQKSANLRNRQIRELALSEQKTAISSAQTLGDALTSVLEASGKKNTAAGKALFLANQAIQVANIIVNTEAAAIAAGARDSTIGGLGGFLASSQGIRLIGHASAGIAAGVGIGQAFEHGGIVGGSSFTGDNIPARLNSGEMVLNKDQQSKLFSMANGGGSGGMPVININSMPGVDVEVQSVSRDEVVLIARKAGQEAVREVNNSLSSGRGDTFKALQNSSRQTRNIG